MPVFNENETGINDIEGQPGASDRTKRRGAWSLDKPPSILKKIPIISIILIILVVLVGVKLFFLESKLTDMKTGISQLKGMSDQMAALQNGFNVRIGAANKEQQRLQSEVAHLRGEIAAMKGRQKRQAEAASQKQAAEAKKKGEKPAEKKAPAKKPSPKEKRP